MFKRNWLGLGKISSNEGFSVYYRHKSLCYTDQRGTFEIGYEDDLLFPTSLNWMKSNGVLSESERALILGRMLQALEWDGHQARLFVPYE